MSFTTSRTHRTRRPTLRFAATLTAGLALALGTLGWANPASAEREFEDAFEAELGRIAAHHVAAVGSLLLFGPPPPVRVVHHPAPHRHHRSCGHAITLPRHAHPRHHAHPGHGHRKHYREHAHGRGRGHAAHAHAGPAGRHPGRFAHRGETVRIVEKRTVVYRDAPQRRERHLARR